MLCAKLEMPEPFTKKLPLRGTDTSLPTAHVFEKDSPFFLSCQFLALLSLTRTHMWPCLLTSQFRVSFLSTQCMLALGAKPAFTPQDTISRKIPLYSKTIYRTRNMDFRTHHECRLLPGREKK